MLKNFLIQGLLAGGVSSALSILYNSIYSEAFYVDFTSVLNPLGIISACVFSCVVIAMGHLLVFKWKAEKLHALYNLLVMILSFASIIAVLGFKLPLELDAPELFAGLAIPMHFFPALAYFALAPFLKR